MIIIGISIIGALFVVWLMRRPVTTADERYWQENNYWDDREITDDIEEAPYVDRRTSAAAMDEAIRRGGDATATYFAVLKEWGY